MSLGLLRKRLLQLIQLAGQRLLRFRVKLAAGQILPQPFQVLDGFVQIADFQRLAELFGRTLSQVL